MLLQGAEGSVPAALITALEHPALSTDPAILCAAARACKAWWEAVQQRGACNTAVVLPLAAPLSRLCSFAHWLPQHAPLVKSIIIEQPLPAPWEVNGLPFHLHVEAAQHLLRQAMQLAAAASTVAAPGQNIATQQQQQQRLNNISSITMAGDAAMLRALPAHSLTSLKLYQLQPTPNRSAVCAALAGLRNLRQLRLQASVSCLAGIAQLSQLTLLEVGVHEEHHAELQQLLAQPLPLRVLHLDEYEELPLLDLSNLTQLQRFGNHMELNAVFPPQLQQLDASWLPAAQYSALMPLRQLQDLRFVVDNEDSSPLLRLAQLPALQQLSLEYQFGNAAAGTAAAWREMRPLCELTLELAFERASMRQWRVILAGLAAATQLTKLQLCAAVRYSAGRDAEGEEDMQGPVCAKLTGLSNLKELRVWHLVIKRSNALLLPPGDALALTALTGLTKLELQWLCDGVGDLAAAAIAGSCKQLCHLDVQDCSLGSMACLASVLHLTQLTELCLQGNSGLTQQGLMLLTGLTRLQQLSVDRTAEITDEVVDSFWAAMKGQL
jgi:hypothetical protein